MMRRIVGISKQLNQEQFEKLVQKVNGLILDEKDKVECIVVTPNIFGAVGTTVSALVLKTIDAEIKQNLDASLWN